MEATPTNVVYVKHTGNGFAVAGLVLGITGAVLGLVPILGLIAIICGGLAVTFGAIGIGKVKRNPEAGRKVMSRFAVALGIVAFGFGVYGVITVNKAVNDLNKSLNQTTQTYDQSMQSYNTYTQCNANAQTVDQLNQCLAQYNSSK